MRPVKCCSLERLVRVRGVVDKGVSEDGHLLEHCAGQPNNPNQPALASLDTTTQSTGQAAHSPSAWKRGITEAMSVTAPAAPTPQVARTGVHRTSLGTVRGPK